MPERAAKEFISLAMNGGRREVVPIIGKVSICGVGGFAIHKTSAGLGFTVSDIKTGLAVPNCIRSTQKTAVSAAIASTKEAARILKITPGEVIAGGRKRAPATLKKMGVPKHA